MSENNGKEEATVGGSSFESLTNSIEVVIRYFMTGVAICSAIYLSQHELPAFSKTFCESYQLAVGIALVVGFFSFAIYRVISWHIIDYWAWKSGLSALVHFPAGDDKYCASGPFAGFLLWRYKDSIPRSLGGYLTFRWSMIHFLIITSLSWLVATFTATSTSFIGAHQGYICSSALIIFGFSWRQFVYLLKVERDLCKKTL